MEDGRLPAGEIEPRLFREIMILPFAIEGVAGSPDEERLLGSKLMKEAARIVEKPGVWTRVKDRRLHLPEDEAPEGKESDEERIRRQRQAYEEFVYFEPYVQRFLYGSSNSEEEKKDAFQLYRRTDVQGIEVAFHKKSTRVHTLAVERCNLYIFETGNVFLVLEVRHKKVTEDGETRRLTLADCQIIIESLRRAFPPFFSEKNWRFCDPTAELEAYYYASSLKLLAGGEKELMLGEGEQTLEPSITAAEAIGSVFNKDKSNGMGAAPIFGPWRALLSPLTIEGVSEPGRGHAVQLSQLGDDRAFTMAQIGVPDSRKIRDSDWARLHQADEPGDSWPYPREFVEEWQHGRIYERFFSQRGKSWHTTRYLVCNYAFVMVGNVTTDEKGEIACSDFFYYLASRHFRRHYFQLVLIAYLHKTALKTLSDRLAEAVEEEESFLEASSELHDEVLRFTHRYWFEEISSQIQGHELFDMLRKELRTRALYDQLNKEIAQTTARRELKRQGKLARSAVILNVIAGVGLAAAALFGFFGMNIFDTELKLLRIDGQLMLGMLFATIATFGFLYTDTALRRWIAGYWPSWGAPIILVSALLALVLLLVPD